MSSVGLPEEPVASVTTAPLRVVMPAASQVARAASPVGGECAAVPGRSRCAAGETVTALRLAERQWCFQLEPEPVAVPGAVEPHIVESAVACVAGCHRRRAALVRERDREAKEPRRS